MNNLQDCVYRNHPGGFIKFEFNFELQLKTGM